jgi:deoxyribonuclease-1
MTLQTRLGQRLRSTLFLALAALLLASCSASLNANRIEAGSAAGSESRTQPGLRADWDQLAELPWPQSGQHVYKSYDDARRVFWSKLYPAGGTELYCGIDFDAQRQAAVPGQKLSVEHAFPADAIAETEPGCTDRTCKASRVQRAMADLQNLWPALQTVNSSRGRTRFGTLPPSVAPRFPSLCPGFRRSAGPPPVVEPRDAIKGDVARSLVYMHFVYGLPLEQAVTDRNLLLDWMALDPPDAEEARRNAQIDRLQGTTNPLLDPAFMGM